MFKNISRAGKNIYIGEDLRRRLDKIVLDVGHHIGRSVTIAEFIHYLVDKSGDEAKERLKEILGTEEERERFKQEFK